MKKLFYRAGGSFIIILIIAAVAFQPVKAQDFDYEGWQLYDAYARMNPRIHFETWIFTLDAVRKEFGFSYIVGYMDGVNRGASYSDLYNDKVTSQQWYKKGLMDGYADRFLYQSRRRCLSLQLFNTVYFGSFGYGIPYRVDRRPIALFSQPQFLRLPVLNSVYFSFSDYLIPFYSVRKWLASISHQRLYALNRCTRIMYVYLRNEYQRNGNVAYVEGSTKRPTRSPTNYRNIEEHTGISASRLDEIPEYEPTDKPTRSENNFRNRGEHTGIALSRLQAVPGYESTEKPTRSPNDYRNRGEHANTRSLTGDRESYTVSNGRIRDNSKKSNTVLHRIYQTWPEFEKYVERIGFNRIHVVSLNEIEPTAADMKKATVEIAIPGRQFNRETSRYITNRLNIDLPEYCHERRTRISRDYDRTRHRSVYSRTRSSSNRGKSRTTVRTSARSSSQTRTRSRQNTRSSSRSRSRGGDGI